MRSLPDPLTQPTMTIEQTAQILGLGRSSCYEAAKRGEIPTIKLGRRLLVPTAALCTLLGMTRPSLPNEPSPPPAQREPRRLSRAIVTVVSDDSVERQGR